VPVWVAAGFSAACEEIIWRGALQGAVERALAAGVRPPVARVAAGLVSFGVAAATLALAGAVTLPALAAQAVAAGARALTGRVSGALWARLAMLATRLALGIFP
jgi:hypothetical protein